MSDVDRLLNRSWWAGALRQRRELDLLAHEEGREHQSVDPHARYEPEPTTTAPYALGPLEGSEPAKRAERKRHGDPDYELTDFERDWLVDRINDAHVLHLTRRNEGRAILVELDEAHVERELEARAVDYFGASHAETLAKFSVLRREHEEHRHEATRQHAVMRKTPDVHAEQLAENELLIAGHATTIGQIDDYLRDGGLIDRHVATVKAEVAEKRSQAQAHVDDADALVSCPHAEHVERELVRVRDELRGKS